MMSAPPLPFPSSPMAGIRVGYGRGSGVDADVRGRSHPYGGGYEHGCLT
jgi:hypothetical protein